MADLIKDLYSPHFFDVLTDALVDVLDGFDKNSFLTAIYDNQWDERAFKQRVHHISTVILPYLSSDFKQSVSQLLSLIERVQITGVAKTLKYPDLCFVFIPDYIEHNGLNDFDASVAAFEKITPFTSCEFAVRPFIIKYEARMLEKMFAWAMSPNEHVRRLASEGSRSRLPWGMAIPALKDNPLPLFPILELLKNDTSLYVRKSVANNLNDISKDNPQVVIDIAYQWKGQSAHTDWILKHACRTLLKAGNQEVMRLFGFETTESLQVNNFSLQSSTVHIGNQLEFSFELSSKSSKQELVRMEYAIYYKKLNGMHTKKVYKISEKWLPSNIVVSITQRQSFKQITTRTFYVGEHFIGLILNGVEVNKVMFYLEA